MIIGTIHPHDTSRFDVDFFYGNRGSFWDILGTAFPNQDFSTLGSIKATLNKYGIWITDIIRECDRKHERVTRDCELYNLKYNNEAINDAIRLGMIDTIYFTSRFGTNNAATLFCRLFGIRYSSLFDRTSSEMVIPSKHFGRPIKGVVLYSPSDDANRGIAGKAMSYKNRLDYFSRFEKPVKQFKIEHYREKFSFLSNE